MEVYGQINTINSISCQSYYLTILYLGRLNPLLAANQSLCTFFYQKLTTTILESAEGRKWPRNLFHDHSPRENVPEPGGIRTRDLLITSWTRIQMSHRGRPGWQMSCKTHADWPVLMRYKACFPNSASSRGTICSIMHEMRIQINLRMRTSSSLSVLCRCTIWSWPS